MAKSRTIYVCSNCGARFQYNGGVEQLRVGTIHEAVELLERL